MEGQNNILIRSIGTTVNNNKGEFLGNIAGTVQAEDDKALEYIILKSNEFFGRGTRFFAIPVTSALIHITERGKIIIQLKKDDLQFAQGIAANRCPQPDSVLGFTVFELYNYDENQPAGSSVHTINTTIHE